MEKKKLEMTLPQAKKYKEMLERKLKRVDDYICNTNNFYVTTEVHLRKLYNPEAENETIIIPKHDELICKPMEVVRYMEDLFFEIQKLSEIIEEEKNKVGLGVKEFYCEETIREYKRVQKALEKMLEFGKTKKEKSECLADWREKEWLKRSQGGPLIPPPSFLQKRKEWNPEKMVTDYKLNADGEQITYQYKVEYKQEPEFDKEAVNAVLQKYKTKEKELTEWMEQKETEIQISYLEKYPENSTIEEDLKIFLAGM